MKRAGDGSYGSEDVEREEGGVYAKKQKYFTNAQAYLKEVKQIFSSQPEKYDQFLEIMKDFKSRRIHVYDVIVRVEDLFKGYTNLLLGFNIFLPEGYEISPKLTPEKTVTVTQFQDAIDFVNKIRKRFDGRVYRSFLDIFNAYRRDEHKGIADVYQDVAALFKDEQDLLMEFTRFLPDTSPKSVLCSPNSSRSSDLGVSDYWALKNQVSDFFRKVSERLFNADRRNDYFELLDCLRSYHQDKITRDELQSMVDNLIGKYPDLIDGFDEILEPYLVVSKLEDKNRDVTDGTRSVKAEDVTSKRRKSVEVEEKDSEQKPKMKGTNDRYREMILGLSNYEPCNPSYRLVDVPPMPSSKRSKVLNDQWVSVTSGSEDHTFKQVHKNQYELCLLRCEEDRSELDVLIERMKSTAKSVEMLLKKINSEKNIISIEDHLTSIHLRCIEALYGDQGMEVIDVLRKNPINVLPVILPRLKQKQEEGLQYRRSFNETWVYRERRRLGLR